MAPEIWRSLYFSALFFIYVGLLAATLYIARKRRKTRWPFKDEDKLLRSPGETLKRRVQALDERFVFEFLGMALAILIFLPIFASVAKACSLTGWSALAATTGGILIVAAVSIWRVIKLWKERANYFLGWFGERLVAEKLKPLELQGYRVFHDVQAVSGEKGFNIDHVVIGPKGVAVIEVKTRRKGNARAGLKDHEVFFDGIKLIWPWGEDTHDVQQALNEAEWLAQWIAGNTGLKIPVRAVLALPGWFVRESPSLRLRVVNPNYLPDVIIGKGSYPLSQAQIELISLQLDRICRDVEE